MTNLEIRTVLRKPVKQVFALLANLANRPAYDPLILKMMETSSGPSRAGSTYRAVSKELGWRTELVMEIQEYIPDKRITFRIDGPNFIQVESWELQPAMTNTRVTSRLEHRPRGILKASESIDAVILRSNFDDRMSRLRRLLEGSVTIS